MKNYVAAFREICKFCLCDNCKMYDACINYPGRISAWSEDMVNKIIEDIRANGTSEKQLFAYVINMKIVTTAHCQIVQSNIVASAITVWINLLKLQKYL